MDSLRMIPSELVLAVFVTGLFAALAYALRMVGRGGAVGGFILGSVIYYCAGWEGFVLLALFVVGGSALTRLGYGRKRASGTAQDRGGRRGAKNALANCSVAVVAAILFAGTGSELFAAAFVASLGAAFADTTESEIGQLYGGNPRLITSLRSVAAGTDGAITTVGTLAGIAAATLMAVAGLAVGLVDGPVPAVGITVAAFLGTVADSLIGARIPRIGNELTNVACTLVAALISAALVWGLSAG